METTEKRKNEPSRHRMDSVEFMTWWVVIALLAPVIGGVLAYIITNWMASLFPQLYELRYGYYDPETLALLLPLLGFLSTLTMAISTVLVSFFQRFLLRKEFSVLFSKRDLWLVLAGAVPGFTVFSLFFWRKDILSLNNISGFIGNHPNINILIYFNLCFTVPLLWQTFIQWRWLRRFVDRAKAWLIVQSSGIVLGGILWILPPNIATFWIFVCYLLTLVASGYVVYRLFTLKPELKN
jgi:hypothetical protein